MANFLSLWTGKIPGDVSNPFSSSFHSVLIFACASLGLLTKSEPKTYIILTAKIARSNQNKKPIVDPESSEKRCTNL